nr:serine/threonine-protein kinase HT1 [Tanacetum cinerariifolium]
MFLTFSRNRSQKNIALVVGGNLWLELYGSEITTMPPTSSLPPFIVCSVAKLLMVHFAKFLLFVKIIEYGGRCDLRAFVVLVSVVCRNPYLGGATTRLQPWRFFGAASILAGLSLLIRGYGYTRTPKLFSRVEVLDGGEDGLATAAETANLRTYFCQEVIVWHKLDHPNVTKEKTKGALTAVGCVGKSFYGLQYQVVVALRIEGGTLFAGVYNDESATSFEPESFCWLI